MCFLCLIVYLSIAQQFTHEFGKYSAEEFTMQNYSKDPTADAVVIYDIGKSYFTYSDDGFHLIKERRQKIKIFNQSGLKWAQIEIPFYEENDGFENIYELSGNTYNWENGVIRTTPLDPKKSYIEKIDNHWNLKKFAMPDVKVGSVFEIEYKIETPYKFNLEWKFQSEIPVIYSEYIAHMIPFYEYSFVLQGASKFDDFKKYIDASRPEQHLGSINFQDMDYDYVMKDVPAFKDETFITSIEDYIMKLDFQLSTVHTYYGSTEEIMTTWPKMILKLQELDFFGKYLKDCQKKAKDITDTMNLNSGTMMEKAEIIDKFVKSNFNWNKNNDNFASKSAKDFVKSKIGNSADVNLFLTGMLNSAGFEAYPVILSTRSHGKLKVDFPFDHFFNYVIAAVKIDGNYILMDATEPMCKFAEIPPRCLNDKGLLINKIKEKELDKVVWLNLKSSKNSVINYSIDLKPVIDRDSIYGDFKIISDGYDALTLRKEYMDNPKKVKDELNLGELVIDSLYENNLKLIENTFDLTFKANTNIEIIDGKILISPFSNMAINDNPLKQIFRSYPIDMTYKQEKRFTSTIRIPEGYKLLSKPKDLKIDNEDINIQYSSELTADNLFKVSGSYEFKKDVYEVFNYIDLKGYFNKIIDKFNEKIILVKI